MRLNYGAIAILLAALAIQACAGAQGPFYWMKQYPDAPVAKQQACMVEAESAYEKAGGTQGRGDNGAAVLKMGTAWERCMEQGK